MKRNSDPKKERERERERERGKREGRDINYSKCEIVIHLHPELSDSDKSSSNRSGPKSSNTTRSSPLTSCFLLPLRLDILLILFTFLLMPNLGLFRENNAQLVLPSINFWYCCDVTAGPSY
ncbi:unnamed protein product [Coffea canephora]|uniref:Uncharacterized protein n=1 Tax=Coffea canephora TaxID=49390 RepID=A0A068TZE6_COFCA|nr:unnamed protein product [Coffea canephora]